jgi:hypothetical protein
MAQGQAQGFDGLLQEFMVDLNGDGVPDVAVPRDAVPERVQTAQIGGAATIPRWFKALVGGGAVAGGATVADRMIRGDGAPPQVVPAEPPPPFTAGAPTNSQFVNYLMQPRADDFPQPKRGGVLDTLNLPPPGQPDEPRNVLLDGLNKAAGVGDYLLGGLPSSVAGLLPWNTMGDVKDNAREAQRRAAETPLLRDAMAMPQAFSGAGLGAVTGMGGAPAVYGRGPQRLLSEDAAARFNKDLDAGNRRLQQVTAPPPLGLPAPPQGSPQFATGSFVQQPRGGYVRAANDPETLVLQDAQQRAQQQGAAYQQRTAIQDREAARQQREAPLMARQERTEQVDKAISDLIPSFEPAYGTRGNMMRLIEDVMQATGAQPWQVIRAMTDKGYDLSGLTRAAMQSPRQGGRFSPMTDESKALWDMIRYDQDVLYRQRAAPYQPEPRNALMPPGGAEPIPPPVQNRRR